MYTDDDNPWPDNRGIPDAPPDPPKSPVFKNTRVGDHIMYPEVPPTHNEEGVPMRLVGYKYKNMGDDGVLAFHEGDTVKRVVVPVYAPMTAAQLFKELKDIVEMNEILEENNTAMELKVAELEGIVSAAGDTIEMLEGQESEADADHQGRIRRTEELQGRNTALEAEVKELKDSVRVLKNCVTGAARTVDMLEEQLQVAQSTIQDQSNRIEELQ